MRRVEVSRATVSYDEGVPAKLREKDPNHALTLGAEVRVTADQDEHGEWRATAIEILRVSPQRKRPMASATVPDPI